MVLLSASGPSLVAKADKESACQCRRHRDMGSIARSGRRSPEGGNGYPLQYSWLKNFMDRGACWATVYWAQRADTTECEPPNHASQVFVLLLECYVFGKKKKVFLVKPKHLFVLFLWIYKLWKIVCLFLCLYKHDSLDFSFPDLIVNSKTSICLYCLHMDLKNLKWIWISVFNSL